MARIRESLGKFRWNRVAFGMGGLIALAGCHSVNKEDNFGSLDLKTRQMLLAPAGGNLKAPQQQYAVTDPAATGATGISSANAFNRGMPSQAQGMAKGRSDTTGYVPVNMPNSTGIVQASVGAPTVPNNPATMQLQPRVQPAVAMTPAQPPVAPIAVPTTPPVVAVNAEPVAPITVVNTAPVTADFTPPPTPTPSPVAPPSLPTPTPGGLTTLHSPVEQPPPSLGPIAPGPLK